MKERCIAVGQTTPARGDVAGNVAEHLKLIEVARDERPQLIVFPELSLTGYEIELARSLAFTREDERLAPLREVACRWDMTVVAGAPVIDEDELHVGALILLPDGTVELYTKQRMGAFGDAARVDGVVPPPEASVFRAGYRDPVLHVGSDSAAIAICADIGHPGHVERAASRGARLYIASMFVIPSEFDADARKLQRFATEHDLIVAMANFGASSGGLASAGRSTVWSQHGTAVVQLPERGSGVGIARDGSGGWQGRIAMT